MSNNQKLYELILKQIRENDKFLITSHESPDGDNIGSMLALYYLINFFDKEVKIILSDKVPDYLSFLPDSDKIQEIETLSQDELERLEKYEVMMVVDASNLERIAKVEDIISEQTLINIDHHIDNSEFGDYNLVEAAAATGEIIYKLFKETKMELAHDFALAIATAIITDTGSFKYSSTTAKTHQIMSELFEAEIDTSYICQQVFLNNTKESLLLTGEVLKDLTVINNKIAYLTVSQSLLKKIGATMEDTEGLVSYALSLKGVEVGILFKEVAKDEVKVSLRSKEFIKVNEIAHKFDGGGHDRAAGLRMKADLEETIKEVIAAVKKELGD